MNTTIRLTVALCSLASVTFAAGSTAIPQFDTAVLTARQPGSVSGVTVTRSELRNALEVFLQDDGRFEADERAHVLSRLADVAWSAGVAGPAVAYAKSFVELNESGVVPSLSLSQLTATPTELFGAAGALSSTSSLQEGFFPNGTGVATQAALQQAYLDAFNAFPGWFQAVNARELLAQLNSRTLSGQPTADEVDGAFAFVQSIARNSSRLYVSSWKTPGRGAPGDLGGYVVAAVSTDRRFVRFIEVTVWSE